MFILKGEIMSRIFLKNNESFPVGATAEVFGSSGLETVRLSNNDAQNITIDSYVDRIEFTQASSDYQFKLSGNIMSIYNDGNILVDLILNDTKQSLVFTDGLANIAITALNSATLGNVALSNQLQTLTDLILDTSDRILPTFILSNEAPDSEFNDTFIGVNALIDENII